MPAQRKYTKKSNGKKTNGRKKSSNGVDKATKSYVDKKLDDAKEDKYLVDIAPINLTQSDAQNDGVHFGYLREITPSFTKGTGVNNRLGNAIFLKYMSVHLTCLPHNYSGSLAQATSNPINTVPFANPIKVNIFRIRAGLGGVLNNPPTVPDLLAKYRRQGVFPQDVLQNTAEQTIKQSIQKIKTLEMVPKYRSGFANVENMSTGVPVTELCIYSIPQETYAECNVSIRQKMLINDNAAEAQLVNKPMKWRYFIYIDYCHQWWRSAYDRTLLQMPNMSMRYRWVFEDA